MHFGEYLRQLRTDKDITLRELARKVDLDFTLLSKMEQGDRPPPELHVIFALADVLEIKADAVEYLLALLTQPPGMENPRVTPDELERFRSSPSLRSFITGKAYEQPEPQPPRPPNPPGLRPVPKPPAIHGSVPRAWQLLARAFLEAFTQVCTPGEEIATDLFDEYADSATPEEVAVWIETVARSGAKTCTVAELQTAAERLANR